MTTGAHVQPVDHSASETSSRDQIPIPPRGWGRITWLGPGFLAMVSATGSGELLFTPRVGALYGYALLWAMLAAIALKWFINREIGRYAVCSGRPLLEGFAELPGPRGWALWLILVPQLVVAVAAIAGFGGTAATALTLVFAGDVRIWMIASVGVATILVLVGHYRGVELTATTIGVALAGASIVAAISVGPDPARIARGALPSLPDDIEYTDILPWLGFLMSGAAGMIWYSYWVVSKGYGAAARPRVRTLDAQDIARLRGWIAQMTFDNSVAVIGTFVITAAFLVLGAELLGPRKLVPEEDRVAEVLGHLLGGVWGPIGYWFMIVGVFIGFWSTLVSNQDGHGRVFANGTRLLLESLGVRGRRLDERRLRSVYVIVLVCVLPVSLYLVVGKPVSLLATAGAVEAIHIPIVTALTLYLNRRTLPRELQPAWPTFIATALAGLFFAVFAVLYVLQRF